MRKDEGVIERPENWYPSYIGPLDRVSHLGVILCDVFMGRQSDKDIKDI